MEEVTINKMEMIETLTEEELERLIKEEYENLGNFQVLIHATNSIDSDSFFENGLNYIRRSFLSTAVLLRDNISYAEQIRDYYYKDYNNIVIMLIPRDIEEFHMGGYNLNVYKERFDISYKEHSVYDRIFLKNIPKGLIFGYLERVDGRFNFIKNPNFISTSKSSKEEIVNKIKDCALPLERMFIGLEIYSKEKLDIIVNLLEKYNMMHGLDKDMLEYIENNLVDSTTVDD